MVASVLSLAWYDALSHKNTVLSNQSGYSVSSVFDNFKRNRAIIFESVLACDKVNHTLPILSIAAIIEILGDTELSTTLPSPSFFPQTFRMKLVSFNHVSSILIILFPYRYISNILRAYYCLRTRFLYELA